ncbi:MAG: S41 family peptidase [Chloroflexaceae bacterium]
MRSEYNLLRMRLPLWLTAMLMALTLFFGVSGGLIVGTSLTPTTNCPESEEVCAEFGVFWQAWEITRKNFVEPEVVDPQEMTEGAISGMLNSLGDQGHTRFLSAEDARRWQESLSGEFEGIGAYLNVREDGQAIIVRPIEGSPAEEAGLQAGDFILEVDGESTQGMTVDELAATIRGPRGTEVTLTVIHPGTELPVDITIERNRIEVPSVTWRMLPNDVALVQLTSFAERSSEEMQQALTEAQEQGAEAVILDLRNNPGGLLNEAVGIASQFLEEGTPVLIEENRADERTTTEARAGGVALNIPLTVMVNLNTASSAEIVSGAMQDAGRAQVLGVPTIGTGTVLTTYQLEDGARLLLGTSQWRTPSGRLIRETGIEPDIEVVLPAGALPLSPSDAAELSAEALRDSEDTQLSAAFELVQEAARR